MPWGVSAVPKLVTSGLDGMGREDNEGKLVPGKSKSWFLVLLRSDLVKYLGNVTTLLQNCCVLVTTQQPLPSNPVCSVVGLDVLEVLCDVSRGRNKLQLVLHNLPSHPAPARASGLGDGCWELLCGEGAMGSVVSSPQRPL